MNIRIVSGAETAGCPAHVREEQGGKGEGATERVFFVEGKGWKKNARTSSGSRLEKFIDNV